MIKREYIKIKEKGRKGEGKEKRKEEKKRKKRKKNEEEKNPKFGSVCNASIILNNIRRI